MSTILQDGTGKGFTQKVDEKNRAWTYAVTTAIEEQASYDGKAFNINTGLITLTNASTKNAVMYVKNNEDDDLVVVQLIYQTGASTSGTGNIIVDVLRNPTAGTIISGASAVEMTGNRNFGSSRALLATSYKGATGTTFTDGTKIFESILATATQRIAVVAGAIVIPKGGSIGINITTPASNSSMAVEFVIACYLRALI